jgi:hypothetical protein
MTFSGCPTANVPCGVFVASCPLSVAATTYPRRSGSMSPARLMMPANPPLPFCRYLPFQPVKGSQTSNVISESSDGRLIPRTSQWAGTSTPAVPCAVFEAAGPAAIVLEVTTVACRSCSIARVSQLRVAAVVCACNGDVTTNPAINSGPETEGLMRMGAHDKSRHFFRAIKGAYHAGAHSRMNARWR